MFPYPIQVLEILQQTYTKVPVLLNILRDKIMEHFDEDLNKRRKRRRKKKKKKQWFFMLKKIIKPQKLLRVREHLEKHIQL